jgi:hypothetical protein
MSKDLYFILDVPSGSYPVRRVNMRDEIFSGGRWRPTEKILKWMVGQELNLEDATKAEVDRLVAAQSKR